MEAEKIVKIFEDWEDKVWCCTWGFLKLDAKDIEDEESKKVPINANEYIVIGGFKSEIRIIYISSVEGNVFPHEFCYKLPGHGAHNVAVSPEGDSIAAVGMDGILSMVDVIDGVRFPRVCHTLISNFWSAAFSTRNDSVYAGTGNGMIYVYDTMLGELKYGYDLKRCTNVVSLAISGDQNLIGAADLSGYFTLIDGCTGQIVRSRSFAKPLRKLAFDPNLKYALAACDDNTIKILDLPNGKMRDSLTGHNASVMSVDTSPDGLRFVSGGADGSVMVWDARTTKCFLSFMSGSKTKIRDVAFNRQSNKISLVGDGIGLCIYNSLDNSVMMPI